MNSNAIVPASSVKVLETGSSKASQAAEIENSKVETAEARGKNPEGLKSFGTLLAGINHVAQTSTWEQAGAVQS